MKLQFRSVFVLLLLLSMLVGGGILSAQSDSHVRFVHAVPGATAVDIYVNNSLAVEGLEFGMDSSYITVPEGNHTVNVTASGQTSSLWTQSISVTGGQAITYIASSPSALEFVAFNDDLDSISFGNTRFLLIHAVPGGPTVDVIFTVDGTRIEGLEYNSTFGTFDVPASSYDVAVVPAGGEEADALVAGSLALTAGTSNMVVVYGSPAQVAVVTAPTQAGENDGLVRFVHSVVGASAVDVYVNDTLLVPNLNIDKASPHIALPAGTHEVMLAVVGTDTEIASTSVTVQAGTASTVVALGTPAGISVETFADDVSVVSGTNAGISVINAIPESGGLSVTLADGTEIASGLAFGEASDAVAISSMMQGYQMTVTINGSTGTIDILAQPLYDGVYYNAIAVAGDAFSAPTLQFEATNLARGLSSSGVVIADNTTDNVEPTEAPTDATTDVVVTETPEAPQVVVTADEIGTTARVLINPDANLHLRQLPSAEAFSLGLVPAATVLTVNGREGEPVFVEGQEPPDLEEFVDPATLLEDEDDDLLPEEIWLNVTYTTPDGGTITAWVNALYLEVRDDEGNLQRLADLETVPNNQAGEASNTAVAPPAPPENQVVGEVFNLNVGVNLNIRRTKTTEGEVLATLPLGTVVEVVGVDADREWTFVNYLPAEGGSITGWVSSQYIQYEFNGRRVDIEDMIEREFSGEIEDDRRGEISADASVAPPPTPDPLRNAVVAEVFLDPGASLHLRRNPDATSESLDLIPTATRFVVEGRTLTSDWLQVTFEEQTGWIASPFVVLSFRGEFIELDEIGDEVPIIGATTNTDTDTDENDDNTTDDTSTGDG